MKVLILIDAKNFEQGVFSLSETRKEFRFIDFYKVSNFIVQYLRNNSQYRECELKHLRTYFYTGEFTDKLIDKIQRTLDKSNKNKETIEKILEKAKRGREKQTKFFKIAKDYYFFEIRSKPLQFSQSDLKILQKGVDVQLATDLVDFTHKNIFDIVVILSGDIDLLESIKIAKNYGKQVIIFGNEEVTAEEMKKYADLFINVNRFTNEQLDKFTHVYTGDKKYNDKNER